MCVTVQLTKIFNQNETLKLSEQKCNKSDKSATMV
jgi:hypothetical protein